jgi:hypothetical protein
MDATRIRRLKDNARQRWYSSCRCRRFARHLGFRPPNPQREKRPGTSDNS